MESTIVCFACEEPQDIAAILRRGTPAPVRRKTVPIAEFEISNYRCLWWASHRPV